MSETIQDLPLDQIRPSPRNPRQHFDPASLAELTASVKARSILTPIRVRPVGKHYEIIAGERRYRAAQAAGLATMPAVIDRLVDERQAFEDAVVENIQRASLSPLEEARAFRTLLDQAGPGARAAAAQGIAARIGKSPVDVWNMAKLVDLIPEAAKLIERGLITIRHAIPLARLTPAQQKKAITPPHDYRSDGGLFERDAAFRFDDVVGMGSTTKEDRWAGLKAVSPREFQAWVAKYIRFDPAQYAAAAPLDFGPVADQVQAAAARPGRGKKVISITHDSYVQPDAKTDERVYTCRSWKLADGSDKEAATCDKSVLGVIVVGPEYGATHQVCVNKECDVHWGREKRARARRAKEGGTRGGAAKREAERHEREEKKRQEEQAKAQAARVAWKRSEAARSAAVFEAVKTAKLPALVALLMQSVSKPNLAELAQKLGKPKTAETVLRHLAALELHNDIRDEWWRDRWTAKAKAVGIDVAAVLKAQQKPDAKAEAPVKKGKRS